MNLSNLKRALPALVLAGAVVLAGCGDDDEGSGAASGNGGEPYVIGATSDISGPVAATYGPILEGLRVYVDQLNDDGGIDGHPIELLIRDHKSDPALVASDAKFFNQRETTGIFYAGPSSTLASYLQSAQDAPTLYGNACYPPAPPPEPAPNFFCVGVSPATDAKALVDLLLAHAEEEGKAPEDLKLALVAEDIPGCRVVNKDVIAPDAESRGIDVVANEVVPVTVTNLTPTAEKIDRAGANAVIHYCLSAQMVALGDALGQIEWPGSYMAAGNIPGMIDGVAEVKNPNFFAFDWFGLPSDDLAVFDDIEAAAEAHDAKAPIVDLRWGWSVGIVLHQALEQCGFPCERSKLLEVMGALKVDDPTFLELFNSPLEWSEGNHASPSKTYRLVGWDDDKQEVVGTTDWISVDEVGMGGD
ncbi:MAG TPA: ABC transporter substrate-binding protein [Solirubrobacteraceae bacterium]|nr:ABC transporter substrate-binding protein [Solirubrobacteraceae bacterium]